jgi:hypothetical protein
MGRTKSPAIRREPSEIKIESNGVTKRATANGRTDVSKMLDRTLVEGDKLEKKRQHQQHGAKPEAGVLNLVISIAFIYGLL